MDWLKMAKSNCLFAAVAIYLRFGGRIRWTRPNLYAPFGHFFVVTRHRTFDFLDDFTQDEIANWKWWYVYKLLWYKGYIRKIDSKIFKRWWKNKNG